MKSALPTFLIADDDPHITFAFRQTFRNDAQILTAANGEQALDILRKKHPDLAFLDVTMPVMDGLTVLQEMGPLVKQIPVIIITGFGTMQTAIEAMQRGAFDYLTKPLDIQHLRLIVSRAMEMVRLKQEVRELRHERRFISSPGDIIGRHPTLQSVFKKIGMVALTPNSTTVLITGDSGTGKELVARAIHNAGSTSRYPFVAINGTAVPETLLESELFGHERGAFTGAVRRQDGKFQQAGSGTIFLDEIGDMPFNLQLKLLRVLEEREFSPIGNSQAFPVKARFITATNQDLKALMDAGRFREDLYYRLHVYGIHVPPLRERKDDLPELIQFFIDQQARLLDQLVQTIAPEALAHLQDYDFPGNVRELRNLIISAMTQEKGPVLTWQSFPASLKASLAGVSPVAASPPNLQTARNAAIRRFEHEYLQQILKQTHGNVTAAARLAGIARQSLQRLMQRHGFRSRDFKTEL